ncbi:hypothetical protein WA026_019233 [Henosepilachna vigintioctopunctata]|uniref:Phospholipid/glycerol acyltransferase domain-containing protein n=1 Tax=Henosepilachna vigintioctopunctata TaxID=420089 RepID=A0AAW1UTZ1_9CUCU
MNDVNIFVIVKAALRTTFVFVCHIYYLSYLTWMVILLPLKTLGFKSIYYKIEGEMQYGMLRIVAMWNHYSGYEVLEAGDDITECLEERTLVLVNHQSAGDIAILFSAFINKRQILPNIMWILENFLKYSTIGVVCWIHHDFFIFQGKDIRQRSLEDLKNHIGEYYKPLQRKWLVLFPEGGFLSKRRQRSQEYGQRNSLPHVEHVTIPRIGALETVINTLKPKNSINNLNSATNDLSNQHLKYILDITIGYPNGEPMSILSVLFGHQRPFQTTVYYRLYPISEVPQSNEELQKWILERWVEKEKMLEDFYRSGKFPQTAHSKAPTLVKQNMSDFLILQAKFAASFFSQYLLIKLIYHILNI